MLTNPNGIAGQDSFVKQNGAVTRGMVMTPAERAKLEALSSLEAADVEKQGANPYSFDSTGFQQALDAAKASLAAKRAAMPAPAGPAANEDHRTQTQKTLDNWTPKSPW